MNVRRVERIINSSGKKKSLVWVNAGTGRNRINREANDYDQEIVDRVNSYKSPSWYPTDQIDPNGYSAKLAQLGDKAIRDISKFLSERNRLVFSDFWARVAEISDVSVRNAAKACLTSIFTVVSERQGYFGGGGYAVFDYGSIG